MAAGRDADRVCSLMYFVGMSLAIPASRSQTRRQLASATRRGERADLAATLPSEGPWGVVRRALMV
jgi:hypothetical protein